ncbi:dGTPase [Roseiarcus fermentans]|uniref:Deoxyguanosinetriphosphate triphosphohydrolase-like protein n=1 Tax=Roseiarcus fermentans TaxID=1473586 RepID=A0A366EF56_9HYPH|nr:deoxyguanosinetriphosphate triphosphohydrolase [Roseiarcus fermentans]RBP00963.1 dGTPase [Roseiarcus fermentans]
MASEVERTTRAPYAADPSRARRFVAEPPSPTRTEFQRDRDRIVHSTAFRRLAHKTQVFVHHEGDHFRTRLTHTIEVAQIARALARALRLDDDLAEAVALGHDLGHTPFGHTGEDALDACMRPYGGFDHNSHGLRIVTELESRYAEFDGLNLTDTTIAGLVKHNGPLLDAAGRPTARYRARGVPAAIAAFDRRRPLDLARHASLEAQAAALADDIAYDAHDIDDGLRAGLFTLDEIRRAVPLVAAIVAAVEERYPDLEPARLIHELTRRLITRFIEDAIGESFRRIAGAGVASAEAVVSAGRTLVALSPDIEAADRDVKTFLFAHMYRHPQVQAEREKADAIVRNLFSAFLADPSAMPADWAARAGAGEPARAVADYIAGMTDRFAIHEHARLFDGPPQLR